MTNINEPSLLIASHIVPWNLATGEEKVNKFNGLLLAPHVDKLFDRGFISFKDDGTMIVHDKLDKSLLPILGLPLNTTHKIDSLPPETIPFLKSHRQLFGFDTAA